MHREVFAKNLRFVEGMDAVAGRLEEAAHRLADRRVVVHETDDMRRQRF
jgi:hypothetical protein